MLPYFLLKCKKLLFGKTNHFFFAPKSPPNHHKSDQEKYTGNHIRRPVPEYIEVSGDKRTHDISETHHRGIGSERFSDFFSGIVCMKGADCRIDTPVPDRETGNQDEHSEYKRIQSKEGERNGEEKESEQNHSFLVQKFSGIPDKEPLIRDGDNPDETKAIPDNPLIKREAIGEKQGKSRLHGRESQRRDKSRYEEQKYLFLVVMKIHRRHGLFRCFQMFFPYLREEKENDEQIEKNNRSGDESEQEMGIPTKQSAQNRSDREAESEHRARESEILGSVRCCGDVRNICLTDGDAGTAQPREKSRHDKYPDISRIGKDDVPEHIQKGSNHKDPLTPIDIREPSEKHPAQKHPKRENGESDSHPLFRETETADNEGKRGDNDPVAHHIQKNGEEDNGKGIFFKAHRKWETEYKGNKNIIRSGGLCFCFSGLFSQFEFSDELLVPGHIFLFEIIEELSSFCYHEHDTATGVVVFFMFVQMKLEAFDAFCQDSNLYFRRSGVSLMSRELLHKCLLVFFFECHRLVLW